MQIIKDRQLTDNNWHFINDDSELPATGDITVSLTRWQQQEPVLLTHDGQVGIRLSSTDSTDQISNLDKLALIELDFPAFTDGRLFSHARLLRSKLAYSGEIRAVGNYLADQVFYLSRVGVNAFQLEQQLIPVALAALNDFSVKYQASTL